MSEQIAKLNIEEKLIACIEMAQKRQDDIRALRAENARLREAMQSAYDYITNHRHGKAKAMLFDGLELYRQAALQPERGAK